MKNRFSETALYPLIQQEVEKSYHPAVEVFKNHLKEYYPAAVGILFYGSCLWNLDQQSQNLSDNLFDFYVLVANYTETYQNKGQAFVNWLLPPNVYYQELLWEGQAIRAKYAVITQKQFHQGVSPGSIQSALWARFCQPVRLVYVANEIAQHDMVRMLAQAAISMIKHSLPLVPFVFYPATLWMAAFQQTYRSEIRVEKNGRTAQLYQRSKEYYDQLTVAVLKDSPDIIAYNKEENYFVKTGSSIAWHYLKRQINKWGWFSRRLVGKILNFLRLIKALFTFKNALPYAAWKIKRHTDIDIPLSDWNLRHPLLSLPTLLGRFYWKRRKQKALKKK